MVAGSRVLAITPTVWTKLGIPLLVEELNHNIPLMEVQPLGRYDVSIPYSGSFQN